MKLAYVHKYTFSFLVWIPPQRVQNLYRYLPPAVKRTVSAEYSDSFAPIIKKNKTKKLPAFKKDRVYRRWDGQRRKEQNKTKIQAVSPSHLASKDPEKREKNKPPERFGYKKKTTK